MNRFQNTQVYNSITNDRSTTHDDSSSPFTLIDWYERTGGVSNIDNYVDEYNEYLKSWRGVKNLAQEQDSTTIKDVYISFLKEIVMKYTTSEERRYLKNVDFTNPVEAEAAVPFFAKRIRQIIEIIQRKRHQVKFQKTKYSLKGSEKGLEKVLFDHIMSFIQGEQLESLRFDLPPVTDVVQNIHITLDELYDLDQSYFDNQLLHTRGPEFLSSTGRMYDGYYNIQKASDGRVIYYSGKIYTPSSEELTRIDHRVPLKSNISTVRYGYTHKIDIKSSDRAY